MLFGPVVLWSFESLMLSSISSFVVGCIKKDFSFGLLSVSVWIILESIFVAIELKKLLNSFSITLLSVTVESFICEQIRAYLVGYLCLLTLLFPAEFYTCFSYSLQIDFLNKTLCFFWKGWLHDFYRLCIVCEVLLFFQSPLLGIICYTNYFSFL